MERIRWTIDGNRAIRDPKTGEWIYVKEGPRQETALPELPNVVLTVIRRP
jgi:hypothetical protein